jgi:hypothetical protein
MTFQERAEKSQPHHSIYNEGRARADAFIDRVLDESSERSILHQWAPWRGLEVVLDPKQLN